MPIKAILYNLHWKKELPLSKMAIELNTSRQTVTRLMDDWKIPRRSISEDNLRRFKDMPLNKRKRYTKNANKAALGRVTPVNERIKRAVTIQSIGKLSPTEIEFLKILRTVNINFIPLYAIHIFNIDFAFPKHKIAIEVDGGNWHTTKIHKAGDKKKAIYLHNHGWILLRISRSKGLWSPDILSFVSSLSVLIKERASTHPL